MKGLGLTKTERSWVMYDVGNSAFVLMISTIIPIYFYAIAENALDEATYLAYWGYAASAATVLCALLGPVLGTYSDRSGWKIRMFTAVLGMGVICCAVLGFIQSWMAFLVVLVVARLGLSLSQIFYDSMLIDVADVRDADRVSAAGYAWGYIGSCVPFAVCLVLILFSDSFGMTMSQAMTVSMILVAVWWLAASIPLIRSYTQKHSIPASESKGALRTLYHSIANARSEKKAFLFLVAFFFFIDGVYTIIEEATAYGTALGLNTYGLLGALLVTQIVAFPCTIAFGRLSQRYDTAKLIAVCIVAYILITIFAVFMDDITDFFMLAIFVGFFQGGIQAMSRSYFAKIVPPERSGEFFGIMDIFGKGATFLGTMTVSSVTLATGESSLGILSVVAFLVIGLILFLMSLRIPSNRSETVDITEEALSA
ncbi:MAG: MFS transporter [Thermoplasmata archaeon]|nr:MFS transporter [Thermoplasmata archaeon]